MQKFYVVSKIDENSRNIKKYINDTLTKNGWVEDEEKPELVICVGGDGTLLYAIHKYINIVDECSFIGIHTGTLGFFTDYTADELDRCLEDIITKKPNIKFKNLLEISYDGNQYYALNEMRIENVIRCQVLKVHIDGKYFETFRGTGMCVSTQAGSTAYNRSLKGAVIEEGLELLQLTEITGIHHRKYRSLGVSYIMNKDREIEFISDDFNGAILIYDNKHFSLNDSNCLKVKLSDKKIRIAEYKKVDYLERITDLF